MTRKVREESGFSLPELLVAMAIGSIVIALIATTFWSQTQTSVTQQTMVQMQQNVRAAMFFMQRDIMMAGYSENAAAPSGATITNADSTQLEFTFAEPINEEDNIDNNGDGTVDESEEKDGIDNNGDGPEDEVNELETVRFALQGNVILRVLLQEPANGGAERQNEAIAYNIDRLEFLYTLQNGSSNTTIATQDNRDNIRLVGISILARSEFEDRGYTNVETYTTLAGTVWGPFNDHFQRELVTTTIYCRNMLRQ
jgi:type IV pilus assembly protein PilW